MSFTCGRCRIEQRKKTCTTLEQVRAHYQKSHKKAARKG